MASKQGQYRISIDRILESLNKSGKHQVIQGFILCLTNISVAFHLFSFVFTAPPVGHTCEHDEVPAGDNSTEYSTCSILVSNTTTNETRTYACLSWKFDTEKDSIVSQWNLVCDNVVWGRLPQSLFIVGQGIGALMFSNLSDKFGRFPFLIVAQIMTAVAGIGLAFSPNIIAFNILRLFNGIFQQGIVVIGITILLENFPRSVRIEVATVYALAWSVCCMLLALLAYLFRHLTWKVQQLAYTSVSVTLFLQMFFLKESIRWLITNKKMKRAMKIIEQVVRRNQLEMSSVDLQGIDVEEKMQHIESKTDKMVVVCPEMKTKDDEHYNCLDLFRTWFVFRTSIIIWITWLVDSLTYFSLYLTASSIANDPYLNFFLNALAELPSGPLFYFVGKKFGRRRFFMMFHILAGVCLLVATCIRAFIVDGTGSTTATVIAFVGKIGTTACFNGLFVYAPEVYPTNMRTVGFGAGSTAGRVGGAFSPFIQILATSIPWAPGTLFGILCLIVAVFNFFLPESEGQELPQTTAEMREWKRTILN